MYMQREKRKRGDGMQEPAVASDSHRADLMSNPLIFISIKQL